MYDRANDSVFNDFLCIDALESMRQPRILGSQFSRDKVFLKVYRKRGELRHIVFVNKTLGYHVITCSLCDG